MDLDEARLRVAAVPHWHHKFTIMEGVTTPGSYNPTFMWDHLGMPGDLSGRRVLDVGPSDGYFSMRMAQLGAAVTAVDYRAKDGHGFATMEAVTGLPFVYHQKNIYELTRRELGGFDIVLFLGLLYHLPDMLRALDILRGLCDGTLLLETEHEPDLQPGIAVARYYEAATLGGDPTNFWAPNKACVLSMLRDSGFIPRRDEAWERRLFVDAGVTPGGQPEKMRLAYGVVAHLPSGPLPAEDPVHGGSSAGASWLSWRGSPAEKNSLDSFERRFSFEPSWQPIASSGHLLRRTD